MMSTESNSAKSVAVPILLLVWLWPSLFWYENDKDLKVCFLVTRIICRLKQQSTLPFAYSALASSYVTADSLPFACSNSVAPSCVTTDTLPFAWLNSIALCYVTTETLPFACSNSIAPSCVTTDA